MIWNLEELESDKTYIYFPVNSGKTFEGFEKMYVGQPRMAEGWWCKRLMAKAYCFMEFRQPTQDEFEKNVLTKPKK